MDRFFQTGRSFRVGRSKGFTGGGGVWMGWVGFFFGCFFAIKRKHGGYTPKIAGFIYSLSF